MPDLSGFDPLEKLSSPPEVIFTTAFDQHAVRAFEANALDYLLKPVAPDRSAAALRKLHSKIAKSSEPVRRRRLPWSGFSSKTVNAAGSWPWRRSSCWNPKTTARGCISERKSR
jgi:DNA-binding LytR/AlgR family response regulator